MTELKTLKDFKYAVVGLDEELEATKMSKAMVELLKDDLKQELIKWIKELRKENKELGEYTYVENAQAFIKVVQNNALIKGIKHFANITEEDLKNG